MESVRQLAKKAIELDATDCEEIKKRYEWKEESV